METNGQLNISFKRNTKGETFINRQYYKLPLQILTANEVDDDGTAFLYLLNPSSGMLGGDLFQIDINLEDHASAVVTTPSSNKVYKADGRVSTQMTNVHIKTGCRLEYIPEHTVLFRDSIYEQEQDYYVEKGGQLFFWDTIMPGRIALGECFHFRRFKSQTNIYYDQKLILKENSVIIPEESSVKDIGSLMNNKIFSTCYCVAEHLDHRLMDELRMYIETNQLFAGVSMPDKHILLIKILFESTPNVSAVLADLWDIVRRYCTGKPAFHIRRY